MKKDTTLLSPLFSFLVSIIFLYGLFFLVSFFREGFFALIYTSIIFASGYFIFKAVNFDLKTLTIKHDIIQAVITLLCLIYLISILFLVTSSFSI
jgi:hypothetical protein